MSHEQIRTTKICLGLREFEGVEALDKFQLQIRGAFQGGFAMDEEKICDAIKVKRSD